MKVQMAAWGRVPPDAPSDNGRSRNSSGLVGYPATTGQKRYYLPKTLRFIGKNRG
jgi:hypothetical protein